MRSKTRRKRSAACSLHIRAAGLFAHCTQAQSNLLLFRVHLDDLEVVFLVGFQLDGSAMRISRFRNVAQTLDAFGDLNESSELRGAQNLALHHIANAMLLEEGLPHIRLQLLDAQRQTTVFRLDAKNDGANFLTLLENLRGMLDALGPAQIADVNQSVNAVFNFDEGAEVGQVANPAFHDLRQSG